MQASDLSIGLFYISKSADVGIIKTYIDFLRTSYEADIRVYLEKSKKIYTIDIGLLMSDYVKLGEVVRNHEFNIIQFNLNFTKEQCSALLFRFYSTSQPIRWQNN